MQIQYLSTALARRRKLGRLLVAGGDLVVGAGQAHRRDRRRLGLDAEVGEDVAHQRLVDQLGAEGGAVGGVVERLGDAGAVAGGGADHAVEAGVVDHLDDRRHAAALLADHPRPGAAELDLAGGVGAVAELVLEPLDVEGVALAVGRPARHQEAGDAGVGLGEDEEGVAHRRRAEPLVADELVLGPGPAAVQRRRRGGVGAHVGAALLLGHRHPAERAALAGGRQRALVVVEREEARLPLLGQLRLLAQRRDRRVGHRDRAADAALGLHQQHEHRGAGDVGAGPRLAPGQRVQAVADPDPHQLVPGAVELDLVDAVAVAVVGAQLGLVLVRLEAPADRLARAADRAQLAGAVLGPLGALAAQRLDQRPVGVEGVVVLQRRRLVEDLVGAAQTGARRLPSLDCVTSGASSGYHAADDRPRR